MSAPATLKGKKKQPPPRPEATAETAEKGSVRPRVAELIKKVIDENAPTWKELSKR
jgi:hypothetical protein